MFVRRIAMKIRADSLFISSVLFTIALLRLIPPVLRYALNERDQRALALSDIGFPMEPMTMHYLGIACVAIILIGLIVIWTGYVRRARSAWLVMFVIVWAWAFPIFVRPIFPLTQPLTLPEFIFNAIYEPGPARIWMRFILSFSLMLIALVLPIKSFFLVGERLAAPRRPSPKLIGGAAGTVLLIVIALFVWIHAQVYEIPREQLNWWQQLPPPPPPPNPCKGQRGAEGD